MNTALLSILKEWSLDTSAYFKYIRRNILGIFFLLKFSFKNMGHVEYAEAKVTEVNTALF